MVNLEDGWIRAEEDVQEEAHKLLRKKGNFFFQQPVRR